MKGQQFQKAKLITLKSAFNVTTNNYKKLMRLLKL